MRQFEEHLIEIEFLTNDGTACNHVVLVLSILPHVTYCEVISTARYILDFLVWSNFFLC